MWSSFYVQDNFEVLYMILDGLVLFYFLQWTIFSDFTPKLKLPV